MEDMASGWESVAIKINCNVAMPVANTSRHPERYEITNGDAARVIGTVYAEDAKVFGYSF